MANLFYKPDPNNPTVYNSQNQALDAKTYAAQGGLPNYSNVTKGAVPGYAPLPTLNSATGTSSTPQQVDPIEQFNKNLMELLTRAQGATSKFGDNTALMADRNKVQNIQLNNSTKSAGDLGIQNLAPSDMLNARNNEANLYNPEVKSLNDRMQLNNEAVSKFTQALDSARTLGETYSKYLKPDQATIDGVIQQMKAGFIPSDAVLEKVGKFLPNDIWAQAAAAKKSNSPGTQPTVAEKKGQYLADAKNTLNSSRGEDQLVNPQMYRDTMNEFVRRGLGSSQDFIDEFPLSQYISASNQVGDLKPATSRKG